MSDAERLRASLAVARAALSRIANQEVRIMGEDVVTVARKAVAKIDGIVGRISTRKAST
jgi:hypothetical protein